MNEKMNHISISPPSIQSLFIEMKSNKNILATGTAFIVEKKSEYLLITNRHNFTGRHQETGQCLSKSAAVPDEVVIYLQRTDVKEGWTKWIPISEALYNRRKQPLWIEHPRLGSKADFVALKIGKYAHIGYYPYDLTLRQDISAGPSEIVSVVGFPFQIRAGGCLAVWATGFMASEPEVDYNGLPIFLIDCRSREGQSGSPVIAFRKAGAVVAMQSGGPKVFDGPVCRFLGVYSGRVHKESDIGIVWKTAAIKELIDCI